MRKLIGFGILAVALMFAAPGCDKKEEAAAPAAAEKKGDDKKEAPKKEEAKKEAPKKAEAKKAEAKKAAPAAGGGECDKYVACCKGIVASVPAAKAGCDQMAKTIAAATDDATKAGLEAGCKQGRAAMAQMPNAPAECK